MEPAERRQPSQKASKDPLPIVAACVALVTLGIIVVAWSFIDSLQDNSKKLRLYQVKSAVAIISPHSVEMDATHAAYVEGKKATDKHLASSSLSNQSDPFISSGDYNSAVKLLKKAQTVFVHEMGSRNQSEIDMLLLARIHRKMAFCYFHNHDYESSLKSITLTIRDNPNNPAHLRERAELYRLLGKQDLAGQDIAAAINLERSGGSSNMHAQFDWMQRPAFVEERK